MEALRLIVAVALFLVLPQLGGLIVTRFARRSSALAWPAAAISLFGIVFYWLLWVPASHEPCGTFEVALTTFVLPTGLVVHLVIGVMFGRFARRIRQRRHAGT